MKCRHIKLIMELIFIFILPFIFICFTSEIKEEKTFEYDDSGNYEEATVEKYLTFDNSIIKYTKTPLYNNYLNFNQLSNWKYTIEDDESHPMVLYIDNSGTRKNHIFYIKSNFNDIQIWGSDDNFGNYWNGLPSNTQFYAFANAISTLPYNSMFIRNYPTTNYLTNYGEIELYIEVFDLTQIYGSGYEPSTIQEFENTFDESYYNYTLSTEIIIEDDNIISSNYKVNYTIWGSIKQLLINSLDLNDNILLDLIICYTILWFTMFIIWHILYFGFDSLFHLLDRKRE